MLCCSVPMSKTVALLKSQGDLYATVQLMGRRYLVTKNDVVTVPHLKDVQVGDTIALSRVLEVGSRDFTLRPAADSPPPAISAAAAAAAAPASTRTPAEAETGDSAIAESKQSGGILRPATAHNIDLSLQRPADEARTKGLRTGSGGVPRDWQRYPDSLPYLAEHVVKASATVIEHTKGAMFEVEKFKKRKGYRRHLRFKLGWTRLKINNIELA